MAEMVTITFLAYGSFLHRERGYELHNKSLKLDKKRSWKEGIETYFPNVSLDPKKHCVRRMAPDAIEHDIREQIETLILNEFQQTGGSYIIKIGETNVSRNPSPALDIVNKKVMAVMGRGQKRPAQNDRTPVPLHKSLKRYFKTNEGTRRFHEFSLTSFVGSGSFGVVWEMDKKENRKDCALKVVLVDLQNEEKQNRELDISLNVDHDNLVKAFKIERKKTSAEDLEALVPKDEKNCASIVFGLRSQEMLEVFCITLELCGEDLRKWLREEHDISLPTTYLVQFTIVKNILEGLKYLHSKRIIHRDLKPENIMFSSKGYILPVKIGDYGTCRVLKDPQKSTLTSNVGTDLYRAPETSSKNYTFQSDLFSLGLLIWEVLQLLSLKTLKNYSDRLVNDKEESLIDLNPRFNGLKNEIIKLVERKVENRLENVGQISLKDCNLEKEFIAANSKELKRILSKCKDGWTIHLLEERYKGHFQIRRKGVTLQGRGEKTIICPPGSGTFVLEVRGENFTAADLKIEGRDIYGMSMRGVFAAAANCLFENLVITNFHFGLSLSQLAGNARIKNARFGNVDNPLLVNGDNCDLNYITITNCNLGIEIKDVNAMSAQSVCIINPRKWGIDVSGNCKVLKFLGVEITAEPHAKLSNPFGGIRILECPEGDFVLKNVSCSGFEAENEFGLSIDRNSHSANITITDCNLGKINKSQ